jgi:8-oxo-dGTP pyrophosphatase MutT (NUDIX family)
MPLNHATLKALEAFLARALDQTRQQPLPGSVPLRVAGQLCGFVAPAALDVLRASLPDLLRNGKPGEVTVPDGPLDGVNQALAQLAQALLAGGCVTKWRDELLDVWAAQASIAAVERGVVRPLGLLTRAVHLNAWSPDGQLWVARRALDKPTDPGMWDTLVGGLVGYRESDDMALERESLEEAGLTSNEVARRTPLSVVTRMCRQLPEGYQYEEVLTCDCVLPAELRPQNQDGEVMQIERLSTERVAQMLFESQFTVEAGIVIAQSLIAHAHR